MLTMEQLQLRMSGIGASEIAAIAGLDPYRTPLDVWLAKRGLTSMQPETEPQYWGQALEPVIKARYIHEVHAEDPTLWFDHANETVRHPDHAFALCTPDLRVTGPDGSLRWGVECKNKSAYVAHEWGESGSTNVPAYVQLQCQWSMLVTGVARWDVAVLLGGNEFRRYRLERDPVACDLLLIMARAFWAKVEAGEEPEAEAKDNPKLGQRLRQQTEEVVAAPSEMEEVALELYRAKRDEKLAAERVAAAEARLKQGIGTAAGLLGQSGWRALWKQPKPTTVVDWRALAQRSLDALARYRPDLPATLLVEHTSEKENSRRFTFTPAQDWTNHE